MATTIEPSLFGSKHSGCKIWLFIFISRTLKNKYALQDWLMNYAWVLHLTSNYKYMVYKKNAVHF